jgi:hypothetical protein
MNAIRLIWLVALVSCIGAKRQAVPGPRPRLLRISRSWQREKGEEPDLPKVAPKADSGATALLERLQQTRKCGQVQDVDNRHTPPSVMVSWYSHSDAQVLKVLKVLSKLSELFGQSMFFQGQAQSLVFIRRVGSVSMLTEGRRRWMLECFRVHKNSKKAL